MKIINRKKVKINYFIHLKKLDKKQKKTNSLAIGLNIYFTGFIEISVLII